MLHEPTSMLATTQNTSGVGHWSHAIFLWGCGGQSKRGASRKEALALLPTSTLKLRAHEAVWRTDLSRHAACSCGTCVMAEEQLHHGMQHVAVRRAIPVDAGDTDLRFRRIFAACISMRNDAVVSSLLDTSSIRFCASSYVIALRLLMMLLVNLTLTTWISGVSSQIAENASRSTPSRKL